jgi:hypothetical protein
MYTLKQLADDCARLLAEMPPDTPVESEGCDCVDAAGPLTVEKRSSGPVVVLTRAEKS